MKILYVLHKFLPRYFSGTEIYTFNLAKEMEKRGHEVEIFCADDVEKGEDYQINSQDDNYEGLKVHRINFNRKKAPDVVRFSYDNPVVAEHFRHFLSFNPPDLIHITSFLNLSAAIIDPIKACSIPIVFTATDFWSFCPKSTFLAFDGSLCKKPEREKCLSCIISLSPFYTALFKKIGLSPFFMANAFSLVNKIPGLKNNPFIKGKQALEKRSDYLREKLRKLDLIITPTTFLQNFFLDAGISPKKTLVSGFGLNADKRNPHIDRPLNSPIRFGYIGMLAELKGVDILIKAFSRISYPNKACLKIYGDRFHFPDYFQSLLKLSKNNPGISFEDTFPPEKLGEILAEVDVLMVPSIWYENTPLVVLEAMSAGVPVMASNVPGISQVIKDQVNGILFPRGDEEALAKCLDMVIEKPRFLSKLRRNPPSIKSMRENGNELESIYNQLIKNRNNKIPQVESYGA